MRLSVILRSSLFWGMCPLPDSLCLPVSSGCSSENRCLPPGQVFRGCRHPVSRPGGLAHPWLRVRRRHDPCGKPQSHQDRLKLTNSKPASRWSSPPSMPPHSQSHVSRTTCPPPRRSWVWRRRSRTQAWLARPSLSFLSGRNQRAQRTPPPASLRSRMGFSAPGLSCTSREPAPGSASLETGRVETGSPTGAPL